jgi:hypothetical protein
MDAKEVKIHVKQIESGVSGVMKFLEKNLEQYKKNLGPELAAELAKDDNVKAALKNAQDLVSGANNAFKDLKNMMK